HAVPVRGAQADAHNPADHLAFPPLVHRPAGGGRPLPREDFVVVAVERRALAAAARPIALGGRRRHEVAERALLLAGRRRPVQAVLLVRLADDALRVDARAVAAVLVGIFVLPLHIRRAGPGRV